MIFWYLVCLFRRSDFAKFQFAFLIETDLQSFLKYYGKFSLKTRILVYFMQCEIDKLSLNIIVWYLIITMK